MRKGELGGKMSGVVGKAINKGVVGWLRVGGWLFLFFFFFLEIDEMLMEGRKR